MSCCPLGRSGFLTVVAGLFLAIAMPARGQTPDVVQKSLDTAEPGQTISIRSGTYTLNQPWVVTRSGSQGQPITIRALTPGGAVIDGKAGFLLKGVSHVIIEGFEFRHENIQPAVALVNCRSVQITRNTFHLDDQVAKRQNWIHLTGGKSGQNRIDHNLFEGKQSHGSFIAIDGSEESPFRLSEGDRIDHNHFRNIGTDDDNAPALKGVRAIRLGWSGAVESEAKSAVEYNLFEKCRGDDELVSVRSSGQSIRFNTFINCVGHLSLRAGKNNIIEGNFFIGENRKGIGAMLVQGSGHKIFNNYFEGMSVPALAFRNGSDVKGVGVVPRTPAKDVDLVFNTFVNCLGGTLEIGSNGNGKWKVAPTGIAIANNIVISYGEDLISIKTPESELKWLANIMFHAGDREQIGVDLPNDQIQVVYPKPRRAGGIWRINHNSPAVDAGKGDFDYVTTDIDGQPRLKNPDVGADEFDQTPIKLKPLTEDDVGVKADLAE